MATFVRERYTLKVEYLNYMCRCGRGNRDERGLIHLEVTVCTMRLLKSNIEIDVSPSTSHGDA